MTNIKRENLNLRRNIMRNILKIQKSVQLWFVSYQFNGWKSKVKERKSLSTSKCCTELRMRWDENENSRCCRRKGNNTNNALFHQKFLCWWKYIKCYTFLYLHFQTFSRTYIFYNEKALKKLKRKENS